MGFKMLLILVSSDLLVYSLCMQLGLVPGSRHRMYAGLIFSVYLPGQRESMPYDFTKVPAITSLLHTKCQGKQTQRPQR